MVIANQDPQTSPLSQNEVSTSVAIGIKESCGVWEAGAVGVAVDCPHPRLISTAVLPWDVDRVADTTIS